MTEPQLIRVQPKISVNICTHRYMNPFFVNSLMFMLDYMKSTGMGVVINSHCGVSNIVGGRQNRVHESIADMKERGCTHTFLVDDDMVFSMDIVHKMLAEMNKLTMSGIKMVAMGVNPCRKSPTNLYYTAKGLDGEFLLSRGKAGVEEVSECGLGAFLIQTSILEEVGHPHFEINWSPNASRYDASEEMMKLLSEDTSAPAWALRRDIVLKKIADEKVDKLEHRGEDFFFIRKLCNHGVRVFIDQDISQTMGHAGEFIYSYGSYAADPVVIPVAEQASA